MANDTRPVWVLGGGGIAGIAWELGLLTGLADEGVTIAPDAVVIGTSAGAVVAGQVTSGWSLEQLFERQRDTTYETAGKFRLSQLLQFARAQLFARSPEHAARRIGRLALEANVDDPARQLRVTGARLPVHEWPAHDLRVMVVDAQSGEARALTSRDEASLVQAVAASSAVPLSSLPIEIGGRRYMDGGMRSTLNLDLAPGSGPVIALAPSTASIGPWARISKQRAALGADRVVEIVERDAASRTIQGNDVMDRTIVPALSAAAREQGRREAERVAAVLG